MEVRGTEFESSVGHNFFFPLIIEDSSVHDKYEPRYLNFRGEDPIVHGVGSGSSRQMGEVRFPL